MAQLHQQQQQPLRREHQLKPHRLRNSFLLAAGLTGLVTVASRFITIDEPWNCSVAEINSLGVIIDATQVDGDGFVSYFRMSDEQIPDMIIRDKISKDDARRIAHSCYEKLLPQIEAAVENYCSEYSTDKSI